MDKGYIETCYRFVWFVCSSILRTAAMVGLLQGSDSRHFSAMLNTFLTPSIGKHTRELSIACSSLLSLTTSFTYYPMYFIQIRSHRRQIKQQLKAIREMHQKDRLNSNLNFGALHMHTLLSLKIQNSWRYLVTKVSIRTISLLSLKK